MNNRPRFDAALDRFAKARVICVGDIMLDRYFYGAAKRISPEAPVPVLNVESTYSSLGGAGNVLRNLTALESQTKFFSVIGADAIGYEVTKLIATESRAIGYLITENNRVTSTKIRYVAGHQQLLRADHEFIYPIRTETMSQLVSSMCSEFAKSHVVVISDYGKGVLNEESTNVIMRMARDSCLPIVVDTKCADLSQYKGATVVTPNISELEAIMRTEIKTESEIVRSAIYIIQNFGIANVLVTQGADGMLLVMHPKNKGASYEIHRIPSHAQQVAEVSGAGDTVVAALALGIAAGLELQEAAYLASIAAGIAVGRPGTAAVSVMDLRMALLTEEKIGIPGKVQPASSAQQLAMHWQREGKAVGFANGCFDMLHNGHVQMLAAARKCCDKLIVGINSDASVRLLKGEGRPVHGENERALMLAALTTVDMVVIFEEETPIKIIKAIQPNKLFKGSDYAAENIVGAKFVKECGGEVIVLPRTPGVGTSEIIEKMKGIQLVVSH